MKTHIIVLPLIAVATLAPAVFSQLSPELRYNFEYSCNKERIVIGHCRHDSDQAGYPPTKPEDDYCQMYYPDRPKMGGFEAFGTELRGDVIKTLKACGAMGKPQPVSQALQDDGIDANAEFKVGKQYFDNKEYAKAVDHFKRSAAAGDSFLAYLYLGITYYDLKQYPEAIVNLKTTADIVAAMPDPHYWLGMTYRALKQYATAESEFGNAIRLNREYDEAYKWLGVTQFGEKKYPDAILSFQQALRLKPDDTATIYSIGLTYARLGQKENAMQAYRKLDTLDKKLAGELLDDINAPPVASSEKAQNQTGPKGNAKQASAAPVSQAVDPVAVAHYEKGKQFYEAEEYAKAIPELETAIAMNVDKYRLLAAYIYLGDSYNFHRDYAKTIAAMPKAIALDKDPVFYETLGNAYERTLQFPKALPAFKEAARLDSKNETFLSNLGSDYILNGQPAEARKVYNQLVALKAEGAKYLLDELENKQGAIGVLTKRGQLGLIGQDDAEALEWFRNALRLNPTNIDALFDIGSGLGVCGKHAEALAALRRILALNPKPDQLGTTHYFIGQTYNEMADYAKALPELIEANRLKPDYYTKKELGITYLKTKQFPKALASFQDASKLNPKEIDAHIMIGQTYVAMGQIDNAVAALQEVVALDPKSSRGWREIGNIYFDAKRYPDAGRSYSSALRIDPKDTLAILGIGKTYAAVGRKPEAMRAYTALKPLDQKLAQVLLDEINKQ